MTIRTALPKALALAACAALAGSVAACGTAAGTSAHAAPSAAQAAAQGPSEGSALPGFKAAPAASPAELEHTRATREAQAGTDSVTVPCSPVPAPAGWASVAVSDGVALSAAPGPSAGQEGDWLDVCTNLPPALGGKDGKATVTVNGVPAKLGADGAYRAPVREAFAASYDTATGTPLADQPLQVCITHDTHDEGCSMYQVAAQPRQP